MGSLTNRQQQVFQFITFFIEKNGFPPSMRDIAAHLHINGTLGVMKHLNALETKGFIKRTSGSSRGISLVNAASGSTPVSLPIVGTVRAGLPTLAFEEIEGHFSIDSNLTKGGTFFLRVKGDSMMEAGILDGDLALIRPKPAAENGEIVVALMDGEATMKRFFKERGRIRLQPENRYMEPIIIPAGKELSIVGQVVGIFRSLG